MLSSSQLSFAIRWVGNWSETGQAVHIGRRPLLLLLDVSQALGSNTCQLQPMFRRPGRVPRKLFHMDRKSKGERAAVHKRPGMIEHSVE